jgi:hypothetical protein
MVNKKEKKQFRLRGKKFFLTYSQLNITELEQAKNLILEQLVEKLPKINQYIIAEETHKDGGKHFHIYLEFNQRAEVFGQNYLDLEFEGIKYHGNYVTVKKKDECMRYVAKVGNFIAEPEIPFLDGELYTNYKEYLLKLYEKGGRAAAELHVLKNPELIMKGAIGALKNIEALEKLTTDKKIQEIEANSIIPLENFNVPEGIINWYESGCIETMVVNGISGAGKTEMIKSFLTSKDIKYLLVRNIHGLKNYNPNIHRAVIFDDCFHEKQLSSEEHIALSDTANPADIRILRESIRLLQNTIRIFTTNDVLKLMKGISEGNKAVFSRYYIVDVNKTLFKGDIEIDINMKIRDPRRERKVYENNIKILKELENRKLSGIEPTTGEKFLNLPYHNIIYK